jgi:hypothetical protein
VRIEYWLSVLFLGFLSGILPAAALSSTETIRFENQTLTIKRDPLTRLPLTIRAEKIPLLEIKQINKLTRDQITLTGPLLVKRYKSLLQIEPDQIRLKAAEPVGGTWYVSYWQTVSGLIIYESSLGFSIDPQGKILSLGALLYPQVPFVEGINITRKQALKIGAGQVPDFKKQAYTLLADSIIIYPVRTPQAIKFFKVYAFNFFPQKALHPASVVGGYAVFVDTQTGGVIHRETLFKPLGCCVPENWVPPKPEDLYKGIFGN